MSEYPDITVSTCHSYDIDYKYKYTCTNENCGHVYGRHSKSIDITKKCCGYCGSKLMLPEKLKKDGTPYKNKGLNLFQTFLKVC
ncbi:hypothetical protein BKA69DRAFT_1053474 [Paraphysoderma sedebokerense]|nr:hypothetical protein BKA69DRAFT_1053474 [Paraphysoderma sedebokerense]